MLMACLTILQVVIIAEAVPVSKQPNLCALSIVPADMLTLKPKILLKPVVCGGSA